METTNKKKKGMIKLIAFILMVLLIVALNHYYGWSDIFSGDDWYGNLQQMVKTNFLQAALIYIVVMVIASVVLAVPATLGAIAAFLIGRFFLQDSLRDQIAKNRYISRLLFNKNTKNEMMVLMITRLVPLFPYNLQNFAYGITDISLGKYSLGTFVFMIPGVAMYTVGTYALTGASNKLLYIGLTAAIVVAVMVLSGRNTCRKRRPPMSKFEKWDENCSLESLQNIADACVHCGKCRENCAFLDKYEMDLGDVTKLQEHVYGCFLCGNCDRVCPAGISGRQLFQNLRRMQVRDGKLEEKPYSFVLKEKKDYKFRNYRNATAGRVLFPGCNFPSMFPKTNRKIADLCKAKGIGTVYDCCGKPIAELGLYRDEERIVNRISRELESRDIDEVITTCPNCYYFLKERIPQRVRSIYEVLPELVPEICRRISRFRFRARTEPGGNGTTAFANCWDMSRQ